MERDSRGGEEVARFGVGLLKPDHFSSSTSREQVHELEIDGKSGQGDEQSEL